jgi:hypothetical protein
MSIKDFVDSLNKVNKNELNSLYKKPIKETKGQMPRTQVFHKNTYHQGDILYLPEDKNFKFLLVIVDPYDGSVDAEPLKDILSKNNDVLDGIEAIYSRNYLDLPIIITFDKGSEFAQDSVKNYFKKRNVNIKYALSGRSRMLATVERMNQTIGTILLKRMTSQELITGETSKEWIDDIKPLIKFLNDKKKKPLKKPISEDPIVDKYTGELLEEGEKVRVSLDKPIDTVKNNRLIGKFRSSDIRWTPQIYKITQVLLKPGFPPMYITSQQQNISRTKNQLQVVDDNEKEPDPKFNRGNSEHNIISEILEKRTVNRKIEYKVRWKGYKENEASWISSKEFDRTNDLKEMRKNFNDKIID